jgi:2Fe-2S ferredoxin
MRRFLALIGPPSQNLLANWLLRRAVKRTLFRIRRHSISQAKLGHGPHVVTIGNIPSLEWFQAHPYGKCRIKRSSMPTVTYITPDGKPVIVENAEGNLMTIAVENQVDGIDGDCGGVCSCATCHVHIDAAWTEKVGPPNDLEIDILELEDHREENSRLGCQVDLSAALDGLVVRVVGR